MASEDTSVRPYPVIYRNLMSVGLLGTVYRVGEDASTISGAVAQTLEDGTSFEVCRSVALAMAGQLDEARGSLEARVEDDPQDDSGKVALAITLLFGGDPDWKRWIDNVLATSIDTEVRQAAHGVLGYVGRLTGVH